MQQQQQDSTKRFSQFCYSITAGVGGVVIGTTVGWNSPVTHLLTKGNAVCEPIVWKVTGCYCLGTAVGGLVQGLLAKRIGYRWSAVVYDSAVLVGWLILLEVNSAADWPRTMMVGRLVQGFGTGALGLLVPTYISHVTDFDLRGRTQVFHQAYVYFGVFYSYVFGAIVTYAMLISVCMIWPVFHLIVTLFLPESPYYLYARNDRKKLKTVMCRIKGTEYDVDSDYKELQKYMESFETVHSRDSASTTNTNNALKKRGRKVFFIGAGLVMFQQLCGVNLCILHMEDVFSEFGSMDDTSIKTRVIVMVVALTQVLLCLIPVEMVEFLGRRVMLIISALGMCLSMTALYYVISTGDGVYEGADHRNNKVIILVSVYVCSYSVGWGPVVMLLYTETVRFNKWYSSLIYAGGQFVGCLLVYAFSNENVLKSTYISCAFVSSCLLSIVFVCYLVPETRGLHLNRIRI